MDFLYKVEILEDRKLAKKNGLIKIIISVTYQIL